MILKIEDGRNENKRNKMSEKKCGECENRISEM